MNVFEDLIVELKQENLLESSVIDDMIESDRRSVPHVVETIHSAEIEAETVAELVEPTDAAPNVPEIEEALLGDGSEIGVPQPVHVKPGKEFFKKRAIGEVSSLQMVDHILTTI